METLWDKAGLPTVIADNIHFLLILRVIFLGLYNDSVSA